MRTATTSHTIDPGTGPGSITRLVRSGPLRALLLQGTVLAGGFCSGALLARGLGPAARGDYQVVVLLYTMAAPILGIGVGSGLSSGGRPPWPQPGRLAALLATTAAAGSAAVLLVRLPAGPTAVLCALLWAPLLSPLTEAHLLRAGRPRLVQQLRVVDVLSTSLGISLLSVLGILTLTTAALALLLPTGALRLGVSVWAVGGRARGDSGGLAALLRCTARRYWPWDVVVAATAGIDMIVAAVVLHRVDLGVYAVAGAVGRLALAPFSAVAPYVLAAAAQGERWGRVWLRWLCVPGGLVVALAAALCVAPGTLVELVYGAAYGPAGAVAAILVAAFGVQGLTSALESYSLGAQEGAVSPLPRALAAAVMGVAILAVAGTGRLDAVALALLTLLYAVVACGMTAVRSRRRWSR